LPHQSSLYKNLNEHLQYDQWIEKRNTTTTTAPFGNNTAKTKNGKKKIEQYTEIQTNKMIRDRENIRNMFDAIQIDLMQIHVFFYLSLGMVSFFKK
jgi:hypothetical protein